MDQYYLIYETNIHTNNIYYLLNKNQKRNLKYWNTTNSNPNSTIYLAECTKKYGKRKTIRTKFYNFCYIKLNYYKIFNNDLKRVRIFSNNSLNKFLPKNYAIQFNIC